MIKVYFNGTFFVNEDYNRDGSNSTVVVNNGGERNDKHIFITWCRLISDTKKWTPLACARALRHLERFRTTTRKLVNFINQPMISRHTLFIGSTKARFLI